MTMNAADIFAPPGNYCSQSLNLRTTVSDMQTSRLVKPAFIKANVHQVNSEPFKTDRLRNMPAQLTRDENHTRKPIFYAKNWLNTHLGQ